MSRFLVICLAGCGQSAPPAAPAQPKPALRGVALDDGTVCPVGSRSVVDACLAAHGFCARDVTPLPPALPDLVVVTTHGAVDCAGYYLLATVGGEWAVLQELHRYTHHDPRYDALAVTGVHDETVKGHRVTRLSYTIELVPSEDAPDVQPEHHELACTWATTGFPTCE